MPLLFSTAALMSNNLLEKGVIETIIDRDDMFAMLPFMHVDGKAYVYTRENTLSGAAFAAANGIVTESAADVTSYTALLKILIGDVDVDKFIAGTTSDTNDQVAIQIAAKAKAIARTFHAGVANGDSSVDVNSFDGIQKLVDPNYTFAAGTNGAAISLSMLDQLKDMVVLGADALVMRKGTWRAIKQLMRASGGTRPEMIQLPNFGQPVPAFDGLPVLLNDFLSGTETIGSSGATTCSIYAARFNEADGLHGIYGGGPAGMVVENIGTVQNKDANRIRVKWYASIVLKSNRSISRLSGITNV